MSTPDARSYHVLIVEDTDDIARIMEMTLERLGLASTIASSGPKALDFMAQRMPDLILLDMSLPVMDGWEAASILKKEPATAAIPIIALTAHAMSGDRERALEVGCDDYDVKPIEFERLLEKMRHFLKGKV